LTTDVSQRAEQSAKTIGERIIARCGEIAACTEVEGEITRTFLAPSMRQVHAIVGGWMRSSGMEVRLDAIGNIRGVLQATSADAPRLIIGSHLDTVVNAGAFDGILGVVIALVLVEQMSREGVLPFSIEIIGFSEEEGIRFAKPFLSSLAVVGDLDADTLARADAEGVSVTEAIRRFGLDPADLPATTLHPSTFGYLEFHIEQGPVLDSEGVSLGVVEAIAGQTRMQLTFTGHANHAGTTPMGALRHDALAAAAEWISAIESYALKTPGLVATVGKLEIPSSAGNVIPGRCVASLDVRHAIDAVRTQAVRQYLDTAARTSAARGVTVTHTTSTEQAAVPMDAGMTELLDRAATRSTGKLARRMVSGAGHDAMILARKVRAAMLFLRSPGGISHHPGESVLAEDIDAAVAAGLELLRMLRDDEELLQRLAVCS
jgi:allantoate deiminase